ncbi:glycosyltransferase family 1 protein [Schaalia naturae]|uniref:Glycosyltransferase family 1 protein n=2 Tax=Schaalia naturae TaxID=635203 RepID=A0ABW2SKM8_9ACTO|nr:glycosyltransferase family 1 protein [Actinomyces sp.]
MRGGGVEAVVMNYYRHVDRSCVQFDFLVDEDSTIVPRDEIESLGGRVFEVPPYQRLPRYTRELEILFRAERWPIVHSHVNALSVFPLRAAKRARVPIRIAHSHSTSGRGEHAKNAMKAVLKRLSNLYPTKRFACSEYAGEWLFGKGASFDVVYNAIDLQAFSFSASVRAEARSELGLVGDTFAIGHLGRFMAQKNQAFLVDVFAELARTRPDSVLVFAGDGDSRPLVELRAAERGVADKVMFLGQREDANRLYQAFDAFALPSLYEGLCLVGVEAQRAGLPCLLSDAITREVDVTGTCEFLPVGDPKAWAAALSQIAEAPARDRSLSKHERLRFDDYDIEKAAPKLVACYEHLASEAKRAASA